MVSVLSESLRCKDGEKAFRRQTIRGVKGEVKANINKAVVDALCKEGGLTPDLVWTVFEEVENTEWFVGDKAVKQIWKERDER